MHWESCTNFVTGQNDINGIERKHVKQFVVIGRKIRSYVYNSFVGYRYDAAGFSGSGRSMRLGSVSGYLGWEYAQMRC